MSNLNIEKYYQMTLDLDPKSEGALLIEPVFVNEKSYNKLVKNNSIFSAKSDKAKIHFGYTPSNGARFVITFDSLNLFPQLMDKIAVMAYSLINDGIVNDDGTKGKPRQDLFNSLSSAKAYLNKVYRVPGIEKYFPASMIINIDKLREQTRLGNIHSTNKYNTNFGFGDDIDFSKKG